MSSTERTPEDGPVALVTGAAGGIGNGVLYLATAPFATGTVLTVDAGWTAR
jgi:hypothetical protein